MREEGCKKRGRRKGKPHVGMELPVKPGSQCCQWPACRAPPKFPALSHLQISGRIRDRLPCLSLRPFPFRARASSPCQSRAGFWTCHRHRGSLWFVAPARAQSMSLRDRTSLGLVLLPFVLARRFWPPQAVRAPGRTSGRWLSITGPSAFHQRPQASFGRVRCCNAHWLRSASFRQVARLPQSRRKTALHSNGRLAPPGSPPLDGRSEFQNKTRDGWPMQLRLLGSRPSDVKHRVYTGHGQCRAQWLFVMPLKLQIAHRSLMRRCLAYCVHTAKYHREAARFRQRGRSFRWEPPKHAQEDFLPDLGRRHSPFLAATFLRVPR
jgi:hypothetical protein